jgi:hypothetical protein
MFRFQGAGFRVGFRVEGLELRIEGEGLGFGVWGLGLEVERFHS